MTGDFKVKILALLALLPLTALADDIRAVMFEFTYNEHTMLITHAQAIGGFPSVDACQEAMPKVYGAGSVQLDPGERMQLECSGIKERLADETPKKPGVAL
jgi:hypothetical protein